jgi:hypothetical protein
MSKTIINVDSSFVTFYQLGQEPNNGGFLTNTECGIQKGFCYPVYDEKDLAFQVSVASTEVLTSSNIVVNKVVDGTGTQVTDVILNVAEIGLYGGSVPIYNIYFSFIGSTLTENLADGDCFNLSVVLGTLEAELLYMVSDQCFKKINDQCYTSVLKYINGDNAFGFQYRSFGTFPLLSFTQNRIRLPIYFKEPNNPSNREVYQRSNGTRKTLSARVNKTYKAILDEVLEETHQRLVIALSHDSVIFVPENYINTTGFECIFDNEYNQNFPTIMQNVDIWSADFTIFVTPFNAVNSNC